MSEDLKTSIVLYGSMNQEEMDLWSWVQYVNDFSEALGFPPTHLEVDGDSYKTSNIISLKRTLKKLKTVIEKKEKIDFITLYSLPEEFTQAVFDFDTFLCIDLSPENPFILISIPKNSFNKLNEKEVIKNLSKYIKITDGEIFDMSVLECPFTYVSKMNPPSHYKSLNILKKL